MNKSELIDAIADSAGLTKADAGRALDGFLGAVTGALSKGDSVALVGFGTYSVKDRAERKGRNPQSGEEITIKSAKIPSFTQFVYGSNRSDPPAFPHLLSI